MNPHSMGYVLNKHKITFEKWNVRAKGWKYIDPPNEVIQKLLAKGTWPRLPHVVGVVTVPTLRPDGTVLSEPGYDPQPSYGMPRPGTFDCRPFSLLARPLWPRWRCLRTC